MHSDKPMAASGLISYRIPNAYGGWVMIGASDHADAMKQAARSTAKPQRELLQVWDGYRYVSA